MRDRFECMGQRVESVVYGVWRNSGGGIGTEQASSVNSDERKYAADC